MYVARMALQMLLIPALYVLLWRARHEWQSELPAYRRNGSENNALFPNKWRTTSHVCPCSMHAGTTWPTSYPLPGLTASNQFFFYPSLPSPPPSPYPPPPSPRPPPPQPPPLPPLSPHYPPVPLATYSFPYSQYPPGPPLPFYGNYGSSSRLNPSPPPPSNFTNNPHLAEAAPPPNHLPANAPPNGSSGGDSSSSAPLSNLELLGIAAAGIFGACILFMGCVFVLLHFRKLRRNRVLANTEALSDGWDSPPGGAQQYAAANSKGPAVIRVGVAPSRMGASASTAAKPTATRIADKWESAGWHKHELQATRP